MAGKKVSFGTKPKASVDEWVETRAVVEEPTVDAAPEPEPVPTPEVAPEPQKQKTKRLTLDIPAKLHQRIKGKAVMEGVTMVDMLRDLLEETYG